MPGCDRPENSVDIIYPEDVGVVGRRSRDRGVPLRDVFLFLLAFLALKVLLMVGHGGAAYGAR
ncbi:MAG: hypothetical protein QNJ44_22425 [Rhodobacter sp.]|nr:hypothetical protein [Rhodobacter sp.]